MRKDGSGRISMEYRILTITENIGRLDGNEKWPIIPVGRSDWERSVQRIDGIKLTSYSSSTRANEVITRVTLEYKNGDALAKLLDPSGNKISYSMSRFNIILVEPFTAEFDPDLMVLMKQVSSGYKFSISFTTEVNSVLTVIDGKHKEILAPSGCEIIFSGKKVSFSIDNAALFSLKDGIGISIIW
jgi:hypothetical protein